MAKLYKLTDEHDRTRGKTQWGPGITHEATGDGKELCSDGWIHAYECPLVAVLLNPVHGNFPNPHMWSAEGEVGARSPDGKVGCKKLMTLERLDIPEITTTQRVVFGLLCAKQVCKDLEWNKWADSWLSGEDRSAGAASGAAWAADAANAAAYAAEAAAGAAAKTAEAAAGASWAVSWAAAKTAEAASWAARAANTTSLDLSAIAKQARRLY